MIGAMTATDRSLLFSEWVTIDDIPSFCPVCREGQCAGHVPNCVMDESLSERGYPDQTSRDRARALLTQAEAPTMAPPAARPVVEHCMGNDCADKVACECLCSKCCPPPPPPEQ